MKRLQLEKMISEVLDEALVSKFNTIDKILNALISGKITKQQAKKYINDINRKNSRTDYDDGISCSGNASFLSAKRDKIKQDSFTCGSANTNVRGC